MILHSQAMFCLFITMTQDGWVDIYKDLESGGYAVEGAIYMAIWIVIGAMVFANLIVGVTVTNLQTAYKEMGVVKQVRLIFVDSRKYTGRIYWCHQFTQPKTFLSTSNTTGPKASCTFREVQGIQPK